MSLINKLFPSKESRSNPLNNPANWNPATIESILSGMSGGQSDSGELVNTHTALNISTVWACVNLISTQIATNPFHLYEIDGKGSKTLASDHDYYDLVFNRPNPEQDTVGFRTATELSSLLHGNGFVEIQRDGGGRAAALWHRSALHTKVIRNRNGYLAYECHDNERGDARIILYENMINIMGMTLDGYEGLSVINFHKPILGKKIALDKYSGRFFANNATPGGILTTKNKVKAEDKTKMREDWESLNLGANRHRVAILDQELAFQQITIPQNDAQFLETLTECSKEICSIFGVPSYAIGLLDKGIKCLPADSLITTTSGPKRIVEVVAGETVYGFDGTKLVKSTVKASVKSGEERVYTIRTENRVVRMTGNHRVLARVPVYTHTPNVMGGRNGGDGKKYQVSYETKYIFAKDLTVGSTLVTLGQLDEENSNILPTGRVASIGFMEFCGLLLSDGNLDAKRGVVHISRGQNANYMEPYRQTMRLELGAKTITEGKVGCVPPRNSTKFTNRNTADELVALGLSGVCRTKSVPTWVFGLSDDLKLAFLRGYLDGDGTVSHAGRITFISVNKFMLEQVRHLCMTLGIPVTNLTESQPAGGMCNGHLIQGKSPVFRFTCSDPTQNKRIGSHDVRYTDRLTSAQGFSANERSYPRYGGKDFTAENVKLARVVSITKSEVSEPVFDLQVDGTESFVADGVVVHNSNVEQQAQDLYNLCLRPRINKWEKAFSTKLFPNRGRSAGRYVAGFDMFNFLHPDSASLVSTNQSSIQNGVMSPNEGRARLGLNSIGPAGDGHYIQLNMQSLELANSIVPITDVKTEDDLLEEEEANSLPRIGVSYRGLFKDGVQRILKSSARDYKTVYRCLWPTLDAMAQSARACRPEVKQDSETVRAVEKLIEGLEHRAKKWSEDQVETILDEEMKRAATAFIYAVHRDAANDAAKKIVDQLEADAETAEQEQDNPE